MADNVRVVSMYIVFPVTLADTPIPMERMAVLDGEGNRTYLTANQVWPDARKSLDGSKMIVSFSPQSFMQELAELQQFPDYDQLQVLSWAEAKELMQTEEWATEAGD